MRVVLACSLLLILFIGCTSGSSHVSKQNVLTVEDQSLSTQEFADRLALRLRSVDPIALKNPTVIKQAKEQILSDFANNAIAVLWARKNKISVSVSELNAEIQRVTHQYPDQSAFRESLAKQRVDFDSWKSQINNSLLQNKVMEKVNEGLVEPKEAEIEAFFKANASEYTRKAQAHLKQVVVAKEDQAQIVWRAAQKEKDLSRLAKEYSIAPEAKKGGDLGWVDKGSFEVFDEAFNLNHGGISQVIKSPFGYHVLQLVDKRPDAQLKLADVHASIKRQLIGDREQARFTQWMEAQLKSIKVMRDDPLIQSITVEMRRD